MKYKTIVSLLLTSSICLGMMRRNEIFNDFINRVAKEQTAQGAGSEEVQSVELVFFEEDFAQEVVNTWEEKGFADVSAELTDGKQKKVIFSGEGVTHKVKNELKNRYHGRYSKVVFYSTSSGNGTAFGKIDARIKK